MYIFGTATIFVSDNNKVMRIYQGKDGTSFPIKKHSPADEWLCRLSSGSIRVVSDCKEIIVAATDEAPVFFLVHDGITFHITEGSDDFELLVFSISRDTIVTLYPHLGSEANSALYRQCLVTSAQMEKEIIQMLSLDFQQLQLLSHAHNLLAQDMLHLHLLIHIYLTFYNGIGRGEYRSSFQSFDIINRFYELFSEEESFRHRDSQYFADRLHVSVRYLFEVCKRETGRSPKELINDTVMSEIRHAMLTTGLSFRQISLRFNFPDQTAFTQFFKRNAGMTPTEFKRRYK